MLSGDLSMRIGELQSKYPNYDINQIRNDKGQFTSFVLAADTTTGEGYHGSIDNVTLAVKNRELILRAARGEFQFTDIDFNNGCLFE